MQNVSTGPETDAPIAVTDDASDLCTGCGMCCDGTLFGRVTVYPDDFATLVKYGMPPQPRGDGFAYDQPCPRLTGTVCGIYAERFVTCRRFRCALLRKLDAGAVGVAEAQARIAAARTHIETLVHTGRTGAARRERLHMTRDWAGIAEPTDHAATARRPRGNMLRSLRWSASSTSTFAQPKTTD